MSASPTGSQSLRLSFVLRWLGITLVVLLALQMAVLLSAADWADGIFKQLLIERLVNQAPMGLIGLLLMLLGSQAKVRGDHGPHHAVRRPQKRGDRP